MAGITTDRLIARYSLEERMVNDECSREHLLEIGKTIDWRAVGVYLLSNVELSDIDIEGHNEGLKRTKMLNKWKEKNSFMATYYLLIEAMLKAGKGDQASGVCELLRRTAQGGSSGAQPTASASQGARHSKKDERPDLTSLVNFKGKKETFSVMQRISTHYSTFGVLLLEDKDGTVMSAIEDQYHGKAERINYAILQMWLRGKGKEPVTWGTLIDVLDSIQLKVLAQDMREALGF